MCQFCHQHGDGKKWYLNAANYADDLLSDLRRRKFIIEFFGASGEIEHTLPQLERFSSAPAFVQRMVKPLIVRRMKRDHYGQVLPLEDIEQIFGFVGSIVRVPCICRQVTLGREVGTCYGVSMSPTGGGLGKVFHDLDDSFLGGPDASHFDQLTPEEALAAFRDHEQEGLCHTVWTFVAPFTGGICNCDRRDCLAMQSTVGHDLPVMFRGEYVAAVNSDLCSGCRSCLRQCQFGAMGYGVADRKAFVDPRACYGCGICRSACTQDAIALSPRAEVPAAAKLW
jgi:ferredoxin